MASDKPNWLSRVFGLGEDKQQPAEAAQSAGDRELGPALPDDFVVERVLGEYTNRSGNARAGYDFCDVLLRAGRVPRTGPGGGR